MEKLAHLGKICSPRKILLPEKMHRLRKICQPKKILDTTENLPTRNHNGKKFAHPGKSHSSPPCKNLLIPEELTHITYQEKFVQQLTQNNLYIQPTHSKIGLP